MVVVNAGEESLSVLDPAQAREAGRVALGARPHGLAAAPDGRWIYVTAGHDPGWVLAVDTAEHRVAWKVAVGRHPHQPALTSAGRLLCVPDFEAAQVHVVDVTRRVLVRSLPLAAGGARPLSGHNAIAAGGRVYVSDLSGRALVTLDGDAERVLSRDPLPGEPRPLAAASDARTLYLQLSGLAGFVAWDLEARRERARVEWPRPPGSDPAERTPAHGLGVWAPAGEVWAADRLDPGLVVHRAADLAVLGRVRLPGAPAWIAFSPDGARVYAACAADPSGAGAVAVVDRDRRVLLRLVPVGRNPKRLVALRVP